MNTKNIEKDMKEIEVKILEIDRDQVIQKIEALGATKVFEGPLEAIYFDFPDHALSRREQQLRIRKKGSQTEVTFKENMTKDVAKTADEYSFYCDSHNACIAILGKIGLIKVQTFTKHRISYRLKRIAFEIDTYLNIPSLLEIEAPSIETIKKMVQQLGYTLRDTCPWSADDVIAHYQKKSGNA